MDLKNIFLPESKLTILGLFFLLIIKFLFINEISIILITTFFDVLFFSFILSLFILHRNIFTKILFNFLYLFNFVIFSLYYVFFYDVYQRGIFVSKISPEAISFVLKNLISLKLLGIVFLGILIIYLASHLVLSSKKLFVKKKYLKLISIFSVLIFLFTALFFNLNYNPYADVIIHLKETSNNISLEPSLKDLSLFQEQDSYFPDPSIKLNYKKIIVLTGEEWMFSDFVDEQNSLKNNFFNKVKPNTHSYTNYYTTNQDSRTAIYSLLTSKFIPYEAYLDSTYSIYREKISTLPSLVDYFNDSNFASFFVVSSIEVPDIATPFDWKKIITLDQEVYDSKQYYCSSLFTYETSCEDLSVIEDVKKTLLENDSVFIFQEFIYGHSYKHILDNKKTRTDYYSEYLNQLYDFLEKHSLLDQTLIVITSDHGSRAYNEMTLPSGYHIPFLIVSNNLEYTENSSLSSHLDFKDILFKHILGIDYIPDNQTVMFTGGTNSNLLGYVTSEGDYGIINSSKSLLINYNKRNSSIKEISQDHYSYYNFLQNNFK